MEQICLKINSEKNEQLLLNSWIKGEKMCFLKTEKSKIITELDETRHQASKNLDVKVSCLRAFKDMINFTHFEDETGENEHFSDTQSEKASIWIEKIKCVKSSKSIQNF